MFLAIIRFPLFAVDLKTFTILRKILSGILIEPISILIPPTAYLFARTIRIIIAPPFLADLLLFSVLNPPFCSDFSVARFAERSPRPAFLTRNGKVVERLSLMTHTANFPHGLL